MRHLNKHNTFVKKTVIFSAVIFVVLILVSVYMVKSWPQRTLTKINLLIDNQDYIEAENLIIQFESAQDESLKDLKELCSYNIALDDIEQKNTEAARYRLDDLDGYENTANLLLECSYIDADKLMQEFKFADAYLIYAMLTDYKDSNEMMQEARYQTANQNYDNGDLANAMEIYLSLEGYKDAKIKADETAILITGADTIEEANVILEGINLLEIQKIAELTAARDNLMKGVLAVGANHTVALISDNTVAATGLNDEGQCGVTLWNNIIAVDAGMYHTVGLKADGTVVATGRNEEGQCDVNTWENVTAIAAGAYNTYGLKSDGTIVSTGYAQNTILETLSNIKYINAGAYAAGCINQDSIAFFTHPSLAIHEIGAISLDVSTGYAAALMPDGSVISTLKETPQFEDVIAVYAGSNMLLAIDVEGKVLSHFFDSRDEVNLGEYTEVKAAAAGGSHFAILLNDGSVKVFGDNEYGECDTNDWSLILD